MNMYAHCYRSGEIEVSRKKDLPGAIMIGAGRATDLRRRLVARARHSYDGTTLLVPGIPEADSDDQAEAAMVAFSEFLAK